MNPSKPLSAADLLARNLRRLRDERSLSIDNIVRRTGIAATPLGDRGRQH